MQSEHNARAYIPLGRTKKWGWARGGSGGAGGPERECACAKYWTGLYIAPVNYLVFDYKVRF